MKFSKILNAIQNENKQILIVGDSMIDNYFYCDWKKNLRETQEKIIQLKRRSVRLGGAANTYQVIRALNGKAQLCTVVGCDEEGELLSKSLLGQGNNKIYIFRDVSKVTTKKTRITIENESQLLRIDEEDCQSISHELEQKILDLISLKSYEFDVLILSDYGKGMITDNLARKLIKIFRDQNKYTLVDPKSSNIMKYAGAYLVKPNRDEFLTLMRNEFEMCEEICAEHISRVLRNINIEYLYVTLGECGGILYSQQGKIMKTPRYSVDCVCSIGAGDSVIAGLALAIVHNTPVQMAIQFATVIAVLSIQKKETESIDIQELRSYLCENQSIPEQYDRAILESEKNAIGCKG